MKLKSWFPKVAIVGLALFLVSIFVAARGLTPPGSSSTMATFSQILSLIEQRHVPEAAPKAVIYAGIGGMLNTLDPHTNFLDDEAFRDMRDEQRGSFYGLGIVISKRGRSQPLRVVSPIADTPAARLGVRAGDVITHIRDKREDVDVDTLGLTIQDSVKYLRGPRGTTVEITVNRPGLEKPIVFKVVRDAIRTPAVNLSFMLRSDVGYVHVANFTETTTPELDRALEDLSKRGAKKLVLDLQGNPGGLLDQAVAFASRFLAPDELVVYTEGRLPGSRQDYRALRDVPRVEWPVVVIVNRGSASASEIVAGALQDHDRGLVAGETSFGKGLVQSVYPLSEGTGLALTTQKYYTPVGRSIQRPYTTEEEYYYENFTRGEDSPQRPKGKVFNTETGRVVYGGGGITPDVEVKPPRDPEVLLRLGRESAFARFVTPLGEEARTSYAADPDKMFDEFVAWVAEELPDIPGDELRKASERGELYLRAELALATGGMEARDRVLTDASPVIRKALESFAEAETLLAARNSLRRSRQARVRKTR